MMVYIFHNHNSYLHHDGAFFISSQVAWRAVISIGFTTSLYIYKHISRYKGKEYKKRLSLTQPRRAPRERPLDIFQLAESVIVGNTLPSEVPVPQATTQREVMYYIKNQSLCGQK